MLETILKIVAYAVLPGIMATVGNHLATKSVKDRHKRRAYQSSFWVIFVAIVLVSAFAEISAYRSHRKEEAQLKQELDEMPRKVIALWQFKYGPMAALRSRLKPPMSLTATVHTLVPDSVLKSDAHNLSQRILTWLSRQQEPAAPPEGETSMQYINSSLEFYQGLNAEFSHKFEAEVVLVHDQLKWRGISNRQLDELYLRPTNPPGMRYVAEEIDALAGQLK